MRTKEIAYEYNQRYYKMHKEKIMLQHRQYRLESDKYKKSHAAGMRRYRAENPERVRNYCRQSLQRLKRIVLQVYSINRNYPICACCKERELSFLSIDHVKGGGTQHRKSISVIGSQFYYWLRRNEYPEGFQVLCHNCNMSKYTNQGKCAHARK